MFPDALIDRVDAAVAGIADAQTAPADAAEKHALQQAKAFARGTGQHLAIGPVGRQTLPVGVELVPVDVAFVMIADHHPPGVLRHQARPRADLAGGLDLFRRLVAAEHIDAGVGWIGQDAEHPRMGQPAPNQLAVPCAAIRPAREAQPKFLEASYDAVGRALAGEQIEDRANRALTSWSGSSTI